MSDARCQRKDCRSRKVDCLRVSVTDRCNLRCIYCMPSSGIEPRSSDEILTYEEIAFFVESAAREGITKVRLTGGEPLVRRNFSGLVKKLTSIEGLVDLSLTTNGILLKGYAQELFDAGIRRINVSLDSLDTSTYRYITRGGSLSLVLEGIKTALEVGFSPVKINTVVLRGINDNLKNFVKFIYDFPVHIRFIECMPLAGRIKDLVSSEELMTRLERFGELVEAPLPLGNGPATYFKFKEALGSFGFISSVTERPCHRCTRLRLTSCGELKTCLFSKDSVDVRDYLRGGCSQGVIRGVIRKQITEKMSFEKETAEFGESLFMSQIGG